MRFISVFLAWLISFQSVAAEYPYIKYDDKQCFEDGMKLFEEKQWRQASGRFYALEKMDAASPYMQEACFYQGLCQYYLHEYSEANMYMGRYLKGSSNPEYFRQAIEAKFNIAEQLRMGETKRMYDSKLLPKWAGGEMLAIEIYDEINATIPCDELAIRSLFSKGKLLFDISLFNDAVATLQTLIRRFPRNELAIESYILIEEIFAVQSKIEVQNTDILELARLNLKHFEQDYPKEERIAYAEKLVREIEITFAQSLFDVGQLYERKGQIDAACIYYFQAIRQFPQTDLAKESYQRIEAIAPKDVAEKCFAYMH